jgi:hypothetical protein
LLERQRLGGRIALSENWRHCQRQKQQEDGSPPEFAKHFSIPFNRATYRLCARGLCWQSASSSKKEKRGGVDPPRLLLPG